MHPPFLTFNGSSSRCVFRACLTRTRTKPWTVFLSTVTHHLSLPARGSSYRTDSQSDTSSAIEDNLDVLDGAQINTETTHAHQCSQQAALGWQQESQDHAKRPDAAVGITTKQHDSKVTKLGPGDGPGSASSIEQQTAKPKPTINYIALGQPKTDDALLLSRNADPLNFQTYDKYHFEANVTGPTGRPRRLVDSIAYQTNIALWVKLLAFRRRSDGAQGVYDIWRGMRRREVEIPTTGQYADEMWSTFISEGLEVPGLLDLIYNYAASLAKEEGKRWQPLYTHIVGHYLRSDPTHALTWHRKLREFHPPKPGSLKLLVEAAVVSEKSLKVLRIIYHESTERDLYGAIIKALADCGKHPEALHWHRYLVSMSDLPLNFAAVKPLSTHLAKYGRVQELNALTQEMQALNIPNDDADVEVGAQVRITREMINEVIGDTYGIKPREMSDPFAARAFATKAFSLEFAIKSLSAFGLRTIGPLAMQELAVRCASTEELSAKLDLLKQYKVLIGDCVYNKLLVKSAMDHRQDIMTSVLKSDQHPDVYEDRELQLRLLQLYISREDHAEINKTLMVLVGFDANPLVAGWNLILQCVIESKDWSKITQTVEDMIASNVTVSGQSIKRSFFRLLGLRQPGRRPQVDYSADAIDHLAFVTNTWLRVLQTGGEVPAVAWREVHKRFGMEGRLQELEGLSIYLALFYFRANASSASLHFPTAVNRTFLRRSLQAPHLMRVEETGSAWQQIFSIKRQTAIVEWYFRHIVKPISSKNSLRSLHIETNLRRKTTLSRHPIWARGVALLRLLREMGVPIHTSTVRRACRHRLLILFGNGRSNDWVNRRSKAVCKTMKLGQMVLELNRAWGPSLFNKLPRSLFRAKSPRIQRSIHKEVLGPRRFGKAGCNKPPTHCIET